MDIEKFKVKLIKKKPETWAIVEESNPNEAIITSFSPDQKEQLEKTAQEWNDSYKFSK